MTVDNIWEAWATAYGTDAHRLVRDGIGVPDAFERSKKRVLFVLREPHGWDGADMRDQLRKGVKYAVWRRVGEWAAAVLLDYPPFADVNDKAVLDRALGQVAAINLKKLPGGSIASAADINDHAFSCRELIRRQISEIAPTVLVACGTFGILRWLLEANIRSESTEICELNTGAKLLRWIHPAQRGSKRDRYEAFVELCARAAV